MGRLILRDYQRAALDGLHDGFRAGLRRPLCVCPTGSGKSVIIATFIREALEQWPDTRILMLVHVRELVEQNLMALLRAWPDAPVSVYSAGLRSHDLSGQVVFASIQSIYRRAYDLQKVDLVIVDEAHLIPPAGDGMYRRLLDDLAVVNGGPVPVVGFTATPFRLSSGSLTEGDGAVFDGIAYDVPLLKLIGDGWLCPPITVTGSTRLETKGVGSRGGEFIASQLQAAVDRDHLTEAACDEIVTAGHDRRSWLVFSTGVDHAFHIRDALRHRGISCETVTGETPLGDRKRILAAYKDGRIKALTNDSVLTTGFDAPATDMLAVLRPTQSAGLWVQMCGRGLRTAPGKQDCLVLDFGGNGHRHGPLDQISGRIKNGTGPAPMKDCPECQAQLFAGIAICPHCGHDFEIERERERHQARAALAPLLSIQASPPIPVTRVEYRRHVKPGSPDSLRVDYHCGFTRYSEWVCLEHEGYPRLKAERWWRGVVGAEAPVSVTEALHEVDFISAPSAIRVARDGQHWRVTQRIT